MKLFKEMQKYVILVKILMLMFLVIQRCNFLYNSIVSLDIITLYI